MCCRQCTQSSATPKGEEKAIRQLCYLRRSGASNLCEKWVCAYMHFLHSTLSYNLPALKGRTRSHRCSLCRREHYVFFGKNAVKVNTDFKKSYHLIYQEKQKERGKKSSYSELSSGSVSDSVHVADFLHNFLTH